MICERFLTKNKLVDTLFLDNEEILLAHTEPGILYTEGSSDIDILREWARVLEHSLLSFLEKPYWWETAQNEWPAVRHFSTMRLLVPNFRGVELCDGDKKKDGKTPSLPDGMNRLYWERYEIESYLLIRPKAVVRFVENVKGKEVADRIEEYIVQKQSDWQGLKPKVILSKIHARSRIGRQRNRVLPDCSTDDERRNSSRSRRKNWT